MTNIRHRRPLPIDDRCRIIEILDRLSAEFELWKYRSKDPFEVLVQTVLSQNTNWRNTKLAFDRLMQKFRKPEQLAQADRREIQRLIEPAGLHQMKSARLKQIAQIVCKKYGGDLRKVVRKPIEEARRELLALPGVGYKTADCVLLFAGGRDVLPIDTHIFRVAERLGFTSAEDGYEEVRTRLEALIPSGRRGEAHILLIQHGRRYCRARVPLCGNCPIQDLCFYPLKRTNLPCAQV
ncbi:MAG: endonuclease III [Hadesarchaea archaeon]|nr:endonuclease III [Hadesarchaea archaeon]